MAVARSAVGSGRICALILRVFLSNIVISYLNLKSWVHRPEIS
jgi:hypothetical protein